MKVYSWKTLIITIIAFIIAMIISVSDLVACDSFQILYIIMWLYIFIKGLWISFSRDAFNTDQLNGRIYNKVMKRLFGKWRFIVQWGGPILYLLTLVLFKILPSQTWLSILILIILSMYFIVLAYVRKEVKKEKKDSFL